MSTAPEIGDGLNALAKVINPSEIARLVGSLARWANPEVFRQLPVWFPETARKQPQYKAGWHERQTNRNEFKFEGNTKANMTLARALGVPTKGRPNWTCCHIWGNDDASFSSAHSEVNDPRYYSCPANMVLLPTPLKAFTDSVPQMKEALRLAAFRLFDFLPEGRDTPTAEAVGEWLPFGWDQGEISGILSTNSRIRNSLKNRFSAIRGEFMEASGAYPKEQVLGVASYWTSKLPENLLAELQANLAGKRPVKERNARVINPSTGGDHP